MAKLIHTMIRVVDEEKSVTFYKKALGLDVVRRVDFPTFTLLYLRNSESSAELELTVNKGQDEPYSHGDGYGHIAVTVADLDQAHADFVAQGLEPTPIKTLQHEGELLAKFAFLRDPDGYRIEVLQRGGAYE